jgi:hypothetical protein
MDNELVALVDKAIAHCSGRDIVSSAEITDMLLDIRILLITTNTESEIPA